MELVVSGPLGSDTDRQSDLIVVSAANAPTPTFAGCAISITAGSSVLGFNTEAGYLYGIEYRNSLIVGDWLPLIYDPDYPLPEGWSSSVSTGGVMSITDTNAASQSLRFYRIRSTNP